MLANGGSSVSHRWCEGSIFPPRDTGTDWAAEDFVGAYFTFDTDRLPVGHPLKRIVLEVNSSIRNNNALTVELGILTNGRFTVKETVAEWLDGSNLDVAIPDYGKRYVVLRIMPNEGYTVTSLYIPEKYFYTPVVDRYGRLPNITTLHSSNNYAGWYYMVNDGLITGERTDGSSMYASEICLLKCAPVLGATATSLQNAFQHCRALINLDLSGLNTEKVTNMSYMFYCCNSLQTLDLSGLNTAAVTNMQNMFQYCNSLQTLDLSGLNTEKVTNMSYMFYCCNSLQTLDLSGLNTAAVTNMQNMFQYCNSLQTLDLSGLNTEKVTNMQNMFSYCWNLENFTAPIFRISVAFGFATKLTHDSLMSIINNLATVTTTQTLTIGATNIAKLTTDEIAIATGKGWTVA